MTFRIIRKCTTPLFNDVTDTISKLQNREMFMDSKETVLTPF